MFVTYDDITERISEPPLWWQDGVPRYQPFQPNLATIYGRQVALVRTSCQYCSRLFDVAVLPTDVDLRDELVLYGDLHSVGDPPQHGCIGDSMSSFTLKILEFWNQLPRSDWQRLHKHEVLLPNADDYDGLLLGLVSRTERAGCAEAFTNAIKKKNEFILSEILKRAGVEDSSYYARLWLAKDRRERLLKEAGEHLRFAYHHWVDKV